MPAFSRSQLGVILILGAALLSLWAWRGQGRPPSGAPAARTLTPVFVEVSGAVARPGIFEFPESPTLLRVLERAGAQVQKKPGEEKLPSGSKVEVTASGEVRLGRLNGPRLLTLGLALDLNRASREDLEALPGLGPVLARRLVDYRREHGYFRRLDDLEQVAGIGPKKLARIKPFLVISEVADHD